MPFVTIFSSPTNLPQVMDTHFLANANGTVVDSVALFVLFASWLSTSVDNLSFSLKPKMSNFRFQILYIMTNDNLTVKKVLGKLARNQRLTHNEELFYLVEVLYFSEERAEQILSSQGFKARKVKMQSRKLATAA